MRILQISKYYHPFCGGIELVAKRITQSFIDSKLSVDVIAYGKKNSRITNSNGPHGERVILVKENISISSAPIAFNFERELNNYLNKNHDLTHVFVHLPNPQVHHIIWKKRKILKRRNIKIIAVYHSDIVNQKIFGPIYNMIFRSTMRFYDHFVVSGPQNYLNSNTISKVKSSKIKIIPFIPENELPYRHRKRFNGRVLAIGRLVSYKGFKYLLDAAVKSNIQLRIIGIGPLYNEFKKYENDNIKLLGRVSDEEKLKLIDWAEVMAVPSINRSEAYGMTITEAFSAGLPVLTCFTGSALEYLASDDRSIIVAPKDSDALVKGLKRFIEEPLFYEKVGFNAKEFFDTKLSYDIFRNSFKDLIL